MAPRNVKFSNDQGNMTRYACFISLDVVSVLAPFLASIPAEEYQWDIHKQGTPGVRLAQSAERMRLCIRGLAYDPVNTAHG